MLYSRGFLTSRTTPRGSLSSLLQIAPALALVLRHCVSSFVVFFSLFSHFSLCTFVSKCCLFTQSYLCFLSLPVSQSFSCRFCFSVLSLFFLYVVFLFTVLLFLCLHLFLQPCRVTSLFVSPFTPKHTKKTHKNNMLKNIHTYIHTSIHIYI